MSWQWDLSCLRWELWLLNTGKNLPTGQSINMPAKQMEAVLANVNITLFEVSPESAGDKARAMGALHHINW